jgi:hypothetical protein
MASTPVSMLYASSLNLCKQTLVRYDRFWATA